MSDIALHADMVWTPRNDLGQFISQRLSPAAEAGVTEWARLVLDRAQQLVPVRTGELKGSGKVVVRKTERTVVASVVFTAEHAGYVEWGTGLRGSSSAGAGPYPYSASWPGMPAQPYLRPAADETRSEGREACKREVALALA